MVVEHAGPCRERLLGMLGLCALIWVGLHAVTAFRNFITLLDCSFSGFAPMSILLGLAYVLSLLAVDVFTCVTRSRTAAGIFMKFWAVCGLLAVGISLGDMGLLTDIFLLLFDLLTPCFPLSWLRE